MNPEPLNDEYPPVPYADNAARHAADRDADAALSKRLARLRLTIFLAGAAGVVWMISRGVTPVPVALCAVLFAVFGGLVVWHARVDARVAWFDSLRLVNLRAMSRIWR